MVVNAGLPPAPLPPAGVVVAGPSLPPPPPLGAVVNGIITGMVVSGRGAASFALAVGSRTKFCAHAKTSSTTTIHQRGCRLATGARIFRQLHTAVLDSWCRMATANTNVIMHDGLAH